MGYNLTFFDIILRLVAVMLFALLSWATGMFIFYIIGMTALVTAMTGFCPFGSVVKKDKNNCQE